MGISKVLKSSYEKLIKKKAEDQLKYKLYYDSSHKPVKFNVGYKVLVLFDAASKGFFVPRWEGPYTRHLDSNPKPNFLVLGFV